MLEMKVELGLDGVENWTQPAIPLPFPSLPWKSLRHLTHLPEHSEKTKHLVQFHLFTNEEAAQKCDIVVTAVGAELPPTFLSPFRSAQ